MAVARYMPGMHFHKLAQAGSPQHFSSNNASNAPPRSSTKKAARRGFVRKGSYGSRPDCCINAISGNKWMIAMPYKARLKEGTERKRKKPSYRVTNWSGYNLSLKKRG